MRVFLVAVVAVIVTGCANQVTRTGSDYPAVGESDVRVLLDGKLPECDAEQIGAIHTSPKWNQPSAIAAARREAARLGADHVTITRTWFNPFNDAMVDATAYRCR